MKVKKHTLLLIACVVWTIAGFNVLRIGIQAYPKYVGISNALLSGLVFAVFQIFIFGRLVRKHTARIIGYTETHLFFLKFFDVKSFIIMAIMMGGGIAIRVYSLAPERFIAVFYTGLGTALLLSGILFGEHYCKTYTSKQEKFPK